MKYFCMQTIIYESNSDYNEVIIMFHPILLSYISKKVLHLVVRKKKLDAIDLIKTYKN